MERAMDASASPGTRLADGRSLAGCGLAARIRGQFEAFEQQVTLFHRRVHPEKTQRRSPSSPEASVPVRCLGVPACVCLR